MKSSEPSFPLANRLLGFGVCGFILYRVVSPLLSADSRADLNVVSVLLLLLLVTMVLAGIWCCLFWKKPAPADDEQERLSPVDPVVLANALTCKFFTGTKSAAVFLDVDNGRVHFMNCHVPRRFLSRTERWFSCPINELKAVYVFRHRGESLTIVTVAGKVQIPAQYGDHYSELREALKRWCHITSRDTSRTIRSRHSPSWAVS